MPITATPAGRRLAMAVLLLLAVCGAVIRAYADDPSTLRDIGTLLLVLWLPAIGNLVAWLVKKIPRRPVQVPEFAGEFTPHLRARMHATATPPGFVGSIHPELRRCTLVSGNQGFTARTSQPIAEILAATGADALTLELLRPQAARKHLVAGTRFHLLVGTTAVLQGEVLA